VSTNEDWTILGQCPAPGESVNLRLTVTTRPLGGAVEVPVRVIVGEKPGPKVLLTAVLHGDELNGLGIVQELLFGPEDLHLTSGILVAVPIVNVPGFEAQMRYMPDRRDLNRSFPGREGGSMSSRIAHEIFQQLIMPCDYCLDLHSAASGRTNFPNVRADLRDPTVRELARAFGCELMVNGTGPAGSLRSAATEAGCPTIILEAGEPGKIEPSVMDVGVRGVRNVLRHLGMLDGEVISPAYQTRVDRATWVRADTGGLLRFHVTPGTVVDEGQPLATNISVFGREQNVLVSPVDGIVLGMTTQPAVQPGEPVCHIAIPRKSVRAVRRALKLAPGHSLGRRVRKDLATNVSVSEREAESADTAAVADEDNADVKPAGRRRRSKTKRRSRRDDGD
jgi:predicted deacylase